MFAFIWGTTNCKHCKFSLLADFCTVLVEGTETSLNEDQLVLLRSPSRWDIYPDSGCSSFMVGSSIRIHIFGVTFIVVFLSYLVPEKMLPLPTNSILDEIQYI